VIGAPLKLKTPLAALAISEMVDENMASAARVHAVERGKSLEQRTLIAFGGAAPLHAARVADKLGITRIIVPTGAGVGSAVGMLAAPVAYEVARSLYQRVSELDPDAVNAHIDAMRREAHEIVQQSAGKQALVEMRTAYMRYIGQGHEIAVPLPVRGLTPDDRHALLQAFENEYRRQFGRTIPGLEAEVLSWALSVSTEVESPKTLAQVPAREALTPSTKRSVFDPGSGDFIEATVYRRDALDPGMRIEGPALVVEDETTTVIPPTFTLSVNALGYLILQRSE